MSNLELEAEHEVKKVQQDVEEVPIVHIPDDDTEDNAGQGQDTRKRVKAVTGRKLSEIWTYLTNHTNAHNEASNRCKHCKETVNTRKKSEYAKAHLEKCSSFKKVMMSLSIIDRPQWYPHKLIKTESVNTKQTTSTSLSPASASNKKELKQNQLKVIPATTKAESKRMNEYLAMHFYMTGTSFVRVEDPFLAKAFACCRPGVVLPTRKDLSGPLLNTCYEKQKSRVDDVMQDPNTHVCITSDGWSNIKNEPVINYMAVSPSQSLFLESVYSGETAHTAVFLATDLARVIDALPCNVAGCVTDNTSTNKLAWEILEEKYPLNFFNGCVSHGLHLMVKDGFSPTKTLKRGFPDGYPFEKLMDFVNDCKDIVTYFHNHHVVKAKLTEQQTAADVPALQRPAPTRWGSVQGCLSSIKSSEKILHSLVTERDFIRGNQKQKTESVHVHDVVTSTDFLRNIDKCLEIIAPIDELIKFFQSDSVPVSEVYHAFQTKLPDAYRNMTCLSQAEYKYLQGLITTRFEFMYGDSHGIAYLLDPKYVGEKMPPDLKENVEEFIFEYGDNNVDAKQVMFEEYTEYTVAATKHKTQKTFRYDMLRKRVKSPLDYWITEGGRWPKLQALARKVFAMAPSSAASERNFSTFGFIHSKLRNCLSAESVEKLVYIKTNTAELDKLTLESDDSNTDEDDN